MNFIFHSMPASPPPSIEAKSKTFASIEEPLRPHSRPSSTSPARTASHDKPSRFLNCALNFFDLFNLFYPEFVFRFSLPLATWEPATVQVGRCEFPRWNKCNFYRSLSPAPHPPSAAHLRPLWKICASFNFLNSARGDFFYINFLLGSCVWVTNHPSRVWAPAS